MKAIYTAQAHVAGGRLNGRGRTTDGAVDLVLRPPAELGGKGDGANPEQLLAIGWAACFEATLATAAHRHNVALQRVADAEIDSRVTLMLAGAGDFEIGAEFVVTLPSIDDPQLATKLVRTAEELCPYSKATRGNIKLGLTVNGTNI
jgi:osmotically inducible protein OsmC